MKYKHILLTGGSGKLGSRIRSSGYFSGLLAPAEDALDITDAKSVGVFFQGNAIDAVIHCAALARMSECEKDPARAIDVNITGTANLVRAVMRSQERLKKMVRFVYISTDGVYPSVEGNYSEDSNVMPYNRYGWTKLGGECSVRLLDDYCIIRTRFFDPQLIPFESSATDVYTSSVPIGYLAEAISVLLEDGFVGTINVGAKRLSDYDRYREFREDLKSCTHEDISRGVPFRLAKDASMDSSRWLGIEKKRKRRG